VIVSTKSLCWSAMVRRLLFTMIGVAMVLPVLLWYGGMDKSMATYSSTSSSSSSIQWYQPPHVDSHTTAAGTMDMVTNDATLNLPPTRHWSDSPGMTVRLLQTDSTTTSPKPKDKFRLIRNHRVSTLVSYLAMIAVFFAIFFCRLWEAVEAITGCLCCCRCPWLWQCLCRRKDQQPVAAADHRNENATSSPGAVDEESGESTADTSLEAARNERETHDTSLPRSSLVDEPIGV
jgi:hypothetical protein